MAHPFPVYISRSDGKLEIVTKSKQKESNKPTTAQLNQAPDARGISDYYTELEWGDSKQIDWRKKLGEMLMREIGGKEHQNRSYILAVLPENYRLYEHIKNTASDKTGEFLKPSTNHAKGPNERQDAYLYGHPLGRKKRYRSPSDFFPHLLWLATDETGDPDNCGCKICAPDEIQIFEKPTKLKVEPVVKKEEPQFKKDPSPLKSSVVGRNPMVVIPKSSRPEESQKPIVKPSPSPVQPAAPRAPAVPASTPLAPFRNYEQDRDAQYQKFIYRPGELVWFNKGGAWGLSVIVQRDLYKNQNSQDAPKYLVQPLSHPFGSPPQRIISSEELLRPWLAWSAPGPTHDSLAAAGINYDTIDWKAVLQGQYGPGDAEVDGSIFGAKAIDESYTLIEPLTMPQAAAGERYFNGMYLGAEKVWVGEAIRLRVGGDQDIMVLQHIVDKSRSVHLVGDIYQFATVPFTSGREPAENPHLPVRVRQDLDYRNRATTPSKHTVSFWKLVQPRARINLADVKGRWYESSILLPILRGGPDFARDLRRGEIGDVGQWLNGRGDPTQGQGKIGTQKFDRLEAFGRAVPLGTKISKGLDSPSGDSSFPMEPIVPIISIEEQQSRQLNQGVTDEDISQFMDLEGMDDGYAQTFDQSGGHFYGDPMQR